jgi:hypothetical protein
LLRRHLYTPALRWYALGASLGVATFLSVSYVPDKSTLYLLLGGLPLVATLLPASIGLSIESRRLATTCGMVVTGAQLSAGVSGPLLDVFFVRGSLDRLQVIGTKAVTQALGHLVKLAYFGLLVGDGGTRGPTWTYPLVIGCALAGTRFGRELLGRMDDDRFRLASRALVALIALVFLTRGLIS